MWLKHERVYYKWSIHPINVRQDPFIFVVAKLLPRWKNKLARIHVFFSREELAA